MSGEEFFQINSSTPMEGGYSFYTSTTGTTSTSANSFVSAWDAEKQARQKGNSSQKSSSKQTQNSQTGAKLHSEWQPVLKAESKIKSNKVKIDPNISLNFFNGVASTAKNLNCKPEDLAAAMFLESHFDPNAKNGKYVGLIQMNKTAFDSIPNRKCTYTQYCKLPREKQLQYAEKYLQMRIDEKGLTGKHLTGGQLYTLIRRPASITKKADVEKYQRLIDKIKKVPSRYQK